MFHAVLSSHNPGHWARPSSLVHISSHLGRHPNLWPHLWFFFHGETSAQLLCLALPKGFHPGTHASACQFPQQKKKKKIQRLPSVASLFSSTYSPGCSLSYPPLSFLFAMPARRRREALGKSCELPSCNLHARVSTGALCLLLAATACS